MENTKTVPENEPETKDIGVSHSDWIAMGFVPFILIAIIIVTYLATGGR